MCSDSILTMVIKDSNKVETTMMIMMVMMMNVMRMLMTTIVL